MNCTHLWHYIPLLPLYNPPLLLYTPATPPLPLHPTFSITPHLCHCTMSLLCCIMFLSWVPCHYCTITVLYRTTTLHIEPCPCRFVQFHCRVSYGLLSWAFIINCSEIKEIKHYNIMFYYIQWNEQIHLVEFRVCIFWEHACLFAESRDCRLGVLDASLGQSPPCIVGWPSHPAPTDQAPLAGQRRGFEEVLTTPASFNLRPSYICRSKWLQI